MDKENRLEAYSTTFGRLEIARYREHLGDRPRGIYLSRCVASLRYSEGWYPGGESNPHSRRKRILNPPRLPIPPPGQAFKGVRCMQNSGGRIKLIPAEREAAMVLKKTVVIIWRAPQIFQLLL
jgi:hypothetical protein